MNYPRVGRHGQMGNEGPQDGPPVTSGRRRTQDGPLQTSGQLMTQDGPLRTSGQGRTPGWATTNQWAMNYPSMNRYGQMSNEGSQDGPPQSSGRRRTKMDTWATDCTAVHHGHVGHKGADGGRLGQLGGCAAVKCSDCHRRRVIVNVINAYDNGRLGRQRVVTAVTCYHDHVIDGRFLVIDNALQIGQRHVLRDDIRHAMFNSVIATLTCTYKLAAILGQWSPSIGVTGWSSECARGRPFLHGRQWGPGKLLKF